MVTQEVLNSDAVKLKKEFNKAIKTLAETKLTTLDFQQYKAVLLLMGFITDPVQIGIDKKIEDIWDTCTFVDEPLMKTTSLFNFLCSLLSIEFMTETVLMRLKEQVDHGTGIEENAYGYIINNEFFLKFDLSLKQQNQIQQQMSVYFKHMIKTRKDFVERGSPTIKLNVSFYNQDISKSSRKNTKKTNKNDFNFKNN